MKHALLLSWLLYALCCAAQPAAQGVRYLVIRKPHPAPVRVAAPAAPEKAIDVEALPERETLAPLPVPEMPAVVETPLPALPPPPHGDRSGNIRDLMRSCAAERILLDISANHPLHLLGAALFVGISSGRVTGLYPADFSRGYGPADLRQDLERLAAETGISAATGETWCSALVDVVGVLAYDPVVSRTRFRPLYLHLIWHHPDLARGECLLAVIPWEQACPWLTTYAALPPMEQVSLAEIIETHQYQAFPLHIGGRWLQTLDGE